MGAQDQDAPAPDALLGREAERARVGDVLDGARRGRGGVLVLRGDAGVGKSALLEDARGRAGGMRVLTCSGVQSETALCFASLHQLVRPVLHHGQALPEPQARALRSALGLEAGRSGDDRFLVSLATLSLIAEAAESRPLLCLVDDAHWLDDSSADALVFAARRLASERVAVLFAARDGEERDFEAPDLPTLTLAGLDPVAAGALVDRASAVALSAGARRRLVEGTGGNPLALLELPSAVSAQQLAGSEPLIDPLPVGARVEQAFLTRVRRLPEDTQTLLLVAAADDTGELPVVLRATARLGVASQALDPAERAGLVHVHGTRLAVHHPLVRSAVHQGAPLSARRAAHRALADALDGPANADRRAWHLAAATVEPDEAVVDELERSALRARHRSGFAAASLALERAAALSADEAHKARRLTAAAENAWFAGRLPRAERLLEQARARAGEQAVMADIGRWRGLVEMTRGVPADAHRILMRAATEVAPRDSGRALYLLSLASVAASYAGEHHAAGAVAALADGLVTPDAHPFARMQAHVLLGLGAQAQGDFDVAAHRLRQALEIDLEVDLLADSPGHLLFAGRAALFLGDDEASSRLHHQAATRARASGALGLLTQVLPRLVHAEIWTGHWQSAAADASAGLALAREIGQHELAAHQLVLLALIAAGRGDEDECRAHVSEARELAAAHHLVFVEDFALWALTLLELGLGGADEALARAHDVSGSPAVFWAAFDRVDAAVRAGDRATARAWLDGFEPWAASGGSAWARGVTLHCRALLATDQAEAEQLFVTALAAHAGSTRPFERARTEAAYGEFLRRARRRVEARLHLRTALDTFESLGAAPWAERAHEELRASGRTARRRDPATSDALTPQELQVAQLIARGLTNREVGAQLFVSPRTIDFHLRNVFRKLGITSRTQLVRMGLDATG